MVKVRFKCREMVKIIFLDSNVTFTLLNSKD